MACGGDGRGFHTFLKITSLKVNVIAQLEFEFGYYDVKVQYVRHYTPQEFPL